MAGRLLGYLRRRFPGIPLRTPAGRRRPSVRSPRILLVVGSPARNLFHSFSQFNVQTGESATFTGPGSIASISSRVTGGQRSLIDRLID